MILTDEEIYDLHDEHTWRFEGLNGKEFRFIARAIEREVLRKLREREPSGYLIDWPGEPDLGDYFAYEPSGCGRSRPLHIIPEEHE